VADTKEIKVVKTNILRKSLPSGSGWLKIIAEMNK
jgi:hypothetical protein